MAEKDLLNFISAIASDAEELGYPKTALRLRRIVEENKAGKNSEFPAVVESFPN